MTSRNKGQIRVGHSGSKVIGVEKRETSDKARIGKSGNAIIGNIHKHSNKSPKKIQDLDYLKKEKKHRRQENLIIKFAKKINEFNVLVQNNKVHGRPWYHGFDGNWWWGLTEEGARSKLEKERIKDIETESDEIKIEVEDVLPLPETQIRTVSEMIDQMTAQYSRELPRDPEKRISYIYPLDSNHSFNIVAKNHIKYLKDKYSGEENYLKIEEIDWSQLSDIQWNEKRNVLIHPFLYPFASSGSFIQNSKNFARLLAMKNKIGGFDVADSDKISKSAVDLINKIDIMIVPSNFARDAFVNSGVTIPVEVLPHGISDKFLKNDIMDTDNEKLLKLRKMKKKGNILVLFFLIHSGHRKGADLVKRLMKRIQKKFDNVYLVVKTNSCTYFSQINSICIRSWLSDKDLVALYDSCDICLSPSRGGGFELNALEAISRGIPTLVPNGGCFLDLIDYYIPVNLSNKDVHPLPGNPIHIGRGCEIDMDDFEEKLSDVIKRLEYWKDHFRDNSKEIREKYSWRNTAIMLDSYLRKYGFILE